MPHFHDVLCFSHLRWTAGDGRHQRLLRRCARHRRVYVFEAPAWDLGPPRLALTHTDHGVVVVEPRLPAGTPTDVAETVQRHLLDELVDGERLERLVLWYDTPIPLAFTHHLRADVVVYDRGAGLAAADPLGPREQLLLLHADVVFTAGPDDPAAGLAHVEPAAIAGDDAAAWDQAWEEMWAHVEARVTRAPGRTTAPPARAARGG